MLRSPHLFTIYATLDPKLGAARICAFIVEKGTRGLSVGKNKDKFGLRTALMAELLLRTARCQKQPCSSGKVAALRSSTARIA
jgi:alkylation response protein AidB-like acyl-CoA dehydrogenase